MYSIDINFLNDRPEYRPESSGAKPARQRAEVPGKAVLIGGGAVAAVCLAAVGGAWLYLTQVELPRLQSDKSDLDAELSAYLQKEQQYKNLQQEIQQIKAQTDALAGVFNYITPWSALLQDLRDRAPAGVRIQGISQEEFDSSSRSSGPAPEPTASGRPPSVVTIQGIAESFSDVNDFVLLLQESTFFQGSATKLLETELQDYQAQGKTYSDTSSRMDFAQVVAFTVQTQIREVPASDILQELQAKGALGLVNRIQKLQRRGVI